MKKIKKIGKLGVWSAGVVILMLLLSNLWIIQSGRSTIRSSPEEVIPTNVALVLGTSKKLKNGRNNPFFFNRIQAAHQLYISGKVKHFILSGDNRERYYNEPLDMKNALMALGVPESAITLDYAGLSTLDSVVRAKLIFGQENILVVTQKFHSFRAAFLCKSFDMEVQVFLAPSIPFTKSAWVHFREFFARPRALLDVYVIERSPRHLGDKIEISY